MNRKQLGIFKFLLFIFGFAVIAIFYGFSTFEGTDADLDENETFMWLNICICYAVFFVPMFFTSISTNTIDTKITSAANIWISATIFIIADIILIFFVKSEDLVIKYALIIESVLFFLLAIFVYFGYLAGMYIGKTQADEKKSVSAIQELKNAFENLNLKSKSLGEDFRGKKARILRLCEDVKYLSPVDTEQAVALERKLIDAENALSFSNISASEFDSKISEMEILIKQRKLLRK